MGRVNAAFLCFALASLFAGCAGLKDRVRGPGAVYDDRENRWEKYGAYYEWNEVVFKAIETARDSYTFPRSSIDVYRKIRILNRKGMGYGSVRIPSYSGKLSSFKLRMTDSTGREIPFRTLDAKVEFEKSGVISFPKVSPGCVLEIRVRYELDGYYFSFEHWLADESIPILNSSFVFEYEKSVFQYDFKSYGELDSPVVTFPRFKNRPNFTWTRHHVLPRHEMDFRNFIDNQEPRVCIAARKLRGYANVSGWDKLSEKFKKRLLDKSMLDYLRKFFRTMPGLTDDIASDYEKADALLKWAQENITYSDKEQKKISLDRILREKKGNQWEIASLVEAMFNNIGLPTDIIVSRSRQLGGFDPDFPSFGNLRTPLVSVTIDGKDYAAYPFFSACKLGEYPPGFLDMQGLSVKQGRPVPLPGTLSDENIEGYKLAVDVSGNTGEVRMESVLRGFPAMFLRHNASEEKTKPREIFQKRLKDVDKDNVISDFDVSGIDRRGEPVTAGLSFSNAALFISRNNKRQYRFAPLVQEFFTRYDTSRVSAFQTGIAQKVVHEVSFAVPPGKKAEHGFVCREMDNPLFSVRCSVRKTDQALVLGRVLDIKAVSLPVREMKQLYPDILEMNRIRESWVSVE